MIRMAFAIFLSMVSGRRSFRNFDRHPSGISETQKLSRNRSGERGDPEQVALKVEMSTAVSGAKSRFDRPMRRSSHYDNPNHVNDFLEILQALRPREKIVGKTGRQTSNQNKACPFPAIYHPSVRQPFQAYPGPETGLTASFQASKPHSSPFLSSICIKCTKPHHNLAPTALKQPKPSPCRPSRPTSTKNQKRESEHRRSASIRPFTHCFFSPEPLSPRRVELPPTEQPGNSRYQKPGTWAYPTYLGAALSCSEARSLARSGQVAASFFPETKNPSARPEPSTNKPTTNREQRTHPSSSIFQNQLVRLRDPASFAGPQVLPPVTNIVDTYQPNLLICACACWLGWVRLKPNKAGEEPRCVRSGGETEVITPALTRLNSCVGYVCA
jgi:hypothetical protein